jgi:hypothetical protein
MRIRTPGNSIAGTSADSKGAARRKFRLFGDDDDKKKKKRHDDDDCRDDSRGYYRGPGRWRPLLSVC